jgi:flagellar basal-body rod modification protein FlgD
MDPVLATAPTIPTAAPAPAPPPAPAAPRGIASDFDTFLRMLTVQMRNQDPLDPIDSADYAVQLATFSGVEQQVRTNELLTALTSQMGLGGLAEMGAWVGREARAAVPARFDGTPVTVQPRPWPRPTRPSSWCATRPARRWAASPCPCRPRPSSGPA